MKVKPTALRRVRKANWRNNQTIRKLKANLRRSDLYVGNFFFFAFFLTEVVAHDHVSFVYSFFKETKSPSI